jgi:hypothetical protein
MPSRSGPRGGVAAAEFTAGEWDVLVRLPGRAIVAATSRASGPPAPRPPTTPRAGQAATTGAVRTVDDDPRRTVAEGLAGLEAVAAGRSFDSDLVRGVVAAIYAERAADRPDATLAEPRHSRQALLADCREATRILARRADPGDSAAYRQWVQSIVARVRAAAHTPSEPPAADRALLAELGRALELV